VNVLNKQSRTADKGGPPAWRLGRKLTTPDREKPACYEMLHGAWDWRAFVNTILNLRVP
jgi:hypothetical protein